MAVADTLTPSLPVHSQEETPNHAETPKRSFKAHIPNYEAFLSQKLEWAQQSAKRQLTKCPS